MSILSAQAKNLVVRSLFSEKPGTVSAGLMDSSTLGSAAVAPPIPLLILPAFMIAQLSVLLKIREARRIESEHVSTALHTAELLEAGIRFRPRCLPGLNSWKVRRQPNAQ